VTDTDDLSIRCHCGAFRGQTHSIRKNFTNRVICYCDDCQAFVHVLGRDGEVLDNRDTTDIVQFSLPLLSFSERFGNLACVKLSEKRLLRWYSKCCKTPIGNTPPFQAMPFVGLINDCIDKSISDIELEQLVGPVKVRLHQQYAKDSQGTLANPIGRKFSLGLRLGGSLLASREKGDHRLSPFFNNETRKLSATPTLFAARESTQ